jgi:hypothetical protein
MENAEFPSKELNKPKTPAAQVIDEEERFTGSVEFKQYFRYGMEMGGWPFLSFLLSLHVVRQASQVGIILFLGFWTGDVIKSFEQEHYLVSDRKAPCRYLHVITACLLPTCRVFTPDLA